MTSKPVERFEPILINLDGEQGNVYYLMRIASQLSVKTGFESITVEMMSGDYLNALEVFKKTYEDFVILETNKSEILAHFEQVEANKIALRNISQSDAASFNF